MDFLKESLKSQTTHKPNNTNNHEAKPVPHKQPSPSELMSSAKVLAGALGHKKDQELNKGKVAGAASDMLGAAKHYGKLDEKAGLGKYVGKAETYLHKYESSHHSGGPAGTATAADAEGKKKKKEGHGAGEYFKK